MEDTIQHKILRTTGWIFISVGAILVYKGTPPSDISHYSDTIIDAVFEVIDD